MERRPQQTTFSIARCQYGNFIIYQRYILTFMVALGLLCINSTRYMIRSYWRHLEEANSNSTKSGEYQGILDDVVHIERFELWSAGRFKHLAYALYTGNILGHLPGGILSDKYGGKHVLTISALGSALCASLLPFVLGNTNLIQEIVLQLVVGFVHGLSQPAAASLLARWLPKNTLTAPAAFLYSASLMGRIMCNVSSNYFILRMGYWQGSFFVWTGIIIVWYLVYAHMVFNTSEQHPFVRDKEKEIITAEVSSLFPSSIPWMDIIKDTSIWAIAASMTGFHVTTATISVTMFDYVKENYDINIYTHPFETIIFLMCQMACATAVGYFADHLISKNKLDAVYVRSIYGCLGSILCNILFLLASSMQHYSTTITTVIIVTAQVTSVFTIAGVNVNYLDRSRYYAGVVMAISEGVSYGLTLSISIPLRVVYYKNSGNRMQKAFWFSTALNAYTTLLFLKWCKGKRAHWDVVETQEQIRLKKLMRNKRKPT